jgi:two-component system, OmpR family, sensor histidine kinase KdpD
VRQQGPTLLKIEAGHLAAALAAVAGITVAYFFWLHVVNDTTAAVTYLLLVLFVAASSELWVAVAASVAAAVCLDFFFLPPIGRFNIDDPQDWVAFFSFVIVAFVASRLSSVARRREQELGRLVDFSQDALLDTGNSHAIRSLADHLVSRFGLAYAAICLPSELGFERHESGTLSADATPSLADLDGMVSRPEHFVWVVPLQHGNRAIGRLVVGGRRIEQGTVRALSSVVAIATERVHLLEQRERIEAARRGVEIKSTLLASLAHDLRTPLTAIGTAVSNLGAVSLSDAERSTQVGIARAGLDRLTRLFQNLLEMANIDAGGITPSLEWVHPSAVIEAARRQADPALRGHLIKVVDHSGDQVVRVDPRLLAPALAHLLENAGQYSPSGTTITVTHEVASAGIGLVVEDEGAGVAAADLPHLFERFYRGGESHRHGSGTGMGLAIVQGLLVAQGGRVRVENRVEGGSRFSIFVPAEIRHTPND